MDKGGLKTPSAAILDSQSVRTADPGRERACNESKGLFGRKWHLLVNTEELPVEIFVKPTNVRDHEELSLGVKKSTKNW